LSNDEDLNRCGLPDRKDIDAPDCSAGQSDLGRLDNCFREGARGFLR
jgi:hypothetical protein